MSDLPWSAIFCVIVYSAFWYNMLDCVTLELGIIRPEASEVMTLVMTLDVILSCCTFLTDPKGKVSVAWFKIPALRSVRSYAFEVSTFGRTNTQYWRFNLTFSGIFFFFGYRKPFGTFLTFLTLAYKGRTFIIPTAVNLKLLAPWSRPLLINISYQEICLCCFLFINHKILYAIRCKCLDIQPSISI